MIKLSSLTNTFIKKRWINLIYMRNSGIYFRVDFMPECDMWYPTYQLYLEVHIWTYCRQDRDCVTLSKRIFYSGVSSKHESRRP